MRSADIRRHQASQETILASFRADENIGRRRPFRTTMAHLPSPRRSSLSLPFSLYLSIYPSLFRLSAFWVFCVPQWAAGNSTPCAPFRSCHFHLLRVLRRVLIRLWSFANMPCYCAPATIILYTLILSYFSLCFPIPSDHLNTIFFCLSFLFQSFTSCLVASWWCREFSVPSVFLWFVRFLLCIYFRHDLQSQVVVVPTVLFHFILFLVLFCLLLLSVLSISCRFFFFQFFLLNLLSNSPPHALFAFSLPLFSLVRVRTNFN